MSLSLRLLSLLLAALSLLTLTALLVPRYFFAPPKRKTVLVLVLGDVGRSPRMMYHAESFAKAGWQVRLVGYPGSTPIASLLSTPMVDIKHLSSPPDVLAGLPFPLSAPIKVAWQVLDLLHVLLFYGDYGSEYLLVQNPPAIPTLAVAQLASYLRGAKLVIDWHNLGYSILAMKAGEGSLIVRIAKKFEQVFGQKATAHLFVTKAMKDYLTAEWDLQGTKTVLHDRPPPHFKRSGAIDRHELFHRLGPLLVPPIPAGFQPKPTPQSARSLFTTISSANNSLPVLPDDRPALVVSSTSWTADEDFSVLIRALDEYERAYEGGATAYGKGLPRLVVLISGKGPLRAQFETTVAERERSGKWKNVLVRCVWLKIQDYPTFLGSADLGISLHQSSSGLDLPMKVVDMFGCGVPVLARNFACLDELVQDGINGKVFDTSHELAKQLCDLLRGFPNSAPLAELRAYFPDSRTPDNPGGHGRSPRVGKQRMKQDSEDAHRDDDRYEWNSWETHWKDIMGNIIDEPRLRRQKGR